MRVCVCVCLCLIVRVHGISFFYTKGPTQGNPPNPPRRVMALVLGSDVHPIAATLATLAERNMSAAAWQRMERRRQQVGRQEGSSCL